MGDKDSLISPLWCFIISECPQNRGRLLYEWMDGWTDSFKGSKNCRIGIRVGWSWGWQWGPWAMPAGCLLGDWQVCGHPFTSSFNSRTSCSLFFLLPFLSSLHLPFVPSLQYFTFSAAVRILFARVCSVSISCNFSLTQCWEISKILQGDTEWLRLPCKSLLAF